MSTHLAIIIPTYNRKVMLREAVQSLLSQSFAQGNRFDVVVVDDGSTDGTETLALSEFGFHPQFHYLKKNNEERAVARNYGVKWAIQNLKPNWILFFDADDYLLPNSLDAFFSMVSDVENASVIAMYGKIQAWDGTDPLKLPRLMSPHSKDQPSGDISKLVLFKTILPLGATFLRTEAWEKLNGFSEKRELSGSEDRVFLTRLSFLGKVRFIPHWMTLYRQHQQNTGCQRTLKSISVAMEELTPYVQEKFPKNRKSKIYLNRLGVLLKVGSLNSSNFPIEASKLLLKNVFFDIGLLFDKRTLRMGLSIIKKLLFTPRYKDILQALVSKTNSVPS